jgi:hypothetical protein
VTSFAHSLIIGLAAPVLLTIAVAALQLARAEANRARPADDPYRDLRHDAQHAARRRRTWFHLRKHLVMVQGERWNGEHLS